MTTASSWAPRWAKLSAPIDCVRVPSAIVRPTWSAGQATIRPSASESRASAASSGSTPITRAFGASAADRRRDAGGQAAAADRDEDNRDIGHVLGDLEPDGALARR